MRIFELNISEMKRIKLDKDVIVYKNPSQLDVREYSKKVTQIRGTIKDNDLYIWDAYDATHYEIDKQLPGKYINSIMIIANGEDIELEQWYEDSYIGKGPNFEVFVAGHTLDHPAILRLLKS